MGRTVFADEPPGGNARPLQGRRLQAKGQQDRDRRGDVATHPQRGPRMLSMMRVQLSLPCPFSIARR